MEQEQTRMKVEHGLNTTFVTFVDERILDDQQIKEIHESLEPDDGEMVLNFANVTFMSSAVLGLLVRVHKRVRERGGQLKLRNLDPSLQKVFEITQLTKVFDIS